MLTITLLLAGSMAYEEQSGMNYLLASTQRGRESLLRRKIGMAAILTTVVWAVTYGLEFHAFLSICDTSTFAAQIQNLSILQNFPTRCSIVTFLVGLYLFRWLALFACALLTMLVSSLVKRMETAYIACCALVLLPSVLYLYVGLGPLKYLSLGHAVAAMPILQTGHSFMSVCITFCLLVCLNVTSARVLRKRLRA